MKYIFTPQHTSRGKITLHSKEVARSPRELGWGLIPGPDYSPRSDVLQLKNFSQEGCLLFIAHIIIEHERSSIDERIQFHGGAKSSKVNRFEFTYSQLDFGLPSSCHSIMFKYIRVTFDRLKSSMQRKRSHGPRQRRRRKCQSNGRQID